MSRLRDAIPIGNSETIIGSCRKNSDEYRDDNWLPSFNASPTNDRNASVAIYVVANAREREFIPEGKKLVHVGKKSATMNGLTIKARKYHVRERFMVLH
ncbi:hypothetical protein [Nitrosovibrio sp. Nv6]|uniref:hypothetical protein n=1 Tax=Nitrosovibrio sp. Nv6 TaxID=1855340 RepID=UPI000B88BA33|nr:hypothetical protein [Nitrosovibrio sp. Nv6]